MVELIDSVSLSLNAGLMHFIALLPNLIFAAILVVLGWVVGSLVSRFAKKLLELLKFEEFLKSHRVEDALGTVPISKVLVQIVKYYIILVFFQAAVGLLAPGSLTDFLTKIVDFAPKLIAAAALVVLAAILGELAKEKVLEVHEKEAYMRLLANGTKYVIVFLGVVMGLDNVGFSTDVIKVTFVTMLQTVGLAFALAVGLAFGFGGQDAAKDWVKEWRKRLHF